MPRLGRLASLAALLATLAAACSKDRPAAATRPASSAHPTASPRDPRRLAAVDPGMTEDQVTALLGTPDEVRTYDGSRPWLASAQFAWAYGVAAPSTFAFGGLVLFGADHRVMATRSPLDPLGVRARKLPWSDTAVAADRGLSCHLEVLYVDATGAISARVTLRNDGPVTFERRHGHTGIAHDLVVELFDENRHVLARYDTLSLFSPYAPDDTEVMRVPAGGSLADEVMLGGPWTELGKLPPGAYRLRVAFPFEPGRFSVSEPVAFRIPT